MKRFGLIGAGVVGTALGIILSERGWELCGAHDIRPEALLPLTRRTGVRAMDPAAVAREAELLFITTNDSAIESLADELAEAGAFHREQVVVHMSGAQTSASLQRAQELGALVLSVHPLQAFASFEMAEQNLPGSVFSIEGDAAAYEVAVELVKLLGGEYFFIDKNSKPLYHAGACVVSNYLVTLADLGVKLLSSAGISRELATKALIPLMLGTVNNVAQMGAPQALTGPIARGDVSTVEKHMDCMARQAPELAAFYCRLGLETVAVARDKGSASEKDLAAMRRVFARELAGHSPVD